MLMFILGFVAGLAFAAISLTMYIIYQGIKGLDEAHRDGWDMPS